jgi:hypothetical protein
MRRAALLFAMLTFGALPAGAREPVRDAWTGGARARGAIVPGSLEGFGNLSRSVLFRGQRLTLPTEVRLYLCPRGGTPQRGGRCKPIPMGSGVGGGSGGTGGDADDPAVAGWHAGLRPASHAQRGCPPGTTAAAARDNPSVIRCIPS